MNTQHLRYAVEIERTGSISQAASNLSMNQPNLSRAIHDLEEQYGLVLFQRSPKGVSPTQKGAEFLRQAKVVLAELDALETLGKQQSAATELIICSTPGGYAETACAAMAEVVRELGLQIILQYENVAAIIDDLSNDRCHLGVIRIDNDTASYLADSLRERGLASKMLCENGYRLLSATPQEQPPNTELRCTYMLVWDRSHLLSPVEKRFVAEFIRFGRCNENSIGGCQ